MSTTESKPCKHGDLACGQGLWYCGGCSRESRARAYKQLTPEEKAYDDYVDPTNSYHENFDAGCSCHINAPCSHCVGDDSEEEA